MVYVLHASSYNHEIKQNIKMNPVKLLEVV